MTNADSMTIQLITDVTSNILTREGFVQKGRIWKRRYGELLQLYTFARMNVGSSYRPEWGASLASKVNEQKLRYTDLNARWIFEICVDDLGLRLKLFDAFRLNSQIAREDRCQLIEAFLADFVLVRFDKFSTKEDLKRMMGNRKLPLRAQAFDGLPDSWWKK